MVQEIQDKLSSQLLMLNIAHFNAGERQQVLQWEYTYQFPRNIRTKVNWVQLFMNKPGKFLSLGSCLWVFLVLYNCHFLTVIPCLHWSGVLIFTLALAFWERNWCTYFLNLLSCTAFLLWYSKNVTVEKTICFAC